MISTADWDSLVGAISDEDIRDGIEDRVARRFIEERFARVLDVGCVEGELARHLPALRWRLSVANVDARSASISGGRAL